MGVLDLFVGVLAVPEERREEVLLADAVADAVYALQRADLQAEALAAVLGGRLAVFLDIAATVLQ